jgi:hypothetical protein
MTALEEKQTNFWLVSICINTAVSLGIFIDFLLNNAFGYWIPMTIGIVFSAVGIGHGAIIKRARDRVLGTTFGIVLGFLYANIFMINNYQWVYLLIFFWFLGYFFYFLTENYVISTAMTSLIVPILSDITNSVNVITVGLTTTFFMRLGMNIIACFIAICTIYIIHRNELSADKLVKTNFDSIFNTQSEIITMLSTTFFDPEYRNDLYINKIGVLITNITLIENIYMNATYESDYGAKKELKYQTMLRIIEELVGCARRQLCIVHHDSYSHSISSKEELMLLQEELGNKFKNIYSYSDGNTNNLSNKINLILNQVSNTDKLLPEYLFIENMLEMSNIIDDPVLKTLFAYRANNTSG